MDAEQVARNDARYREANERIEAAAAEYAITGPIPFICECADPTCTEVVRMTLEEYEAIRAEPTHFLNVPGHHEPHRPHVAVVRHENGYDVVEKLGRAADVAKDLDPR